MTDDLTDLLAELDAHEQRHAARPWPTKYAINTWRWMRRMWFREIREWHWARRVKWFVQRGHRGWADCDVWSLDSYLSQVISGAIAQLRNESHGTPLPYDEDGSKWRDLLSQIAQPLSVDVFRYVDGESFADLNVREEREREARRAALRLMAEWFDALWD